MPVKGKSVCANCSHVWEMTVDKNWDGWAVCPVCGSRRGTFTGEDQEELEAWRKKTGKMTVEEALRR